ncbi:sensor histidine kinase [Mucilaginibacter rubeus]|uniref:Histidine kinase n=1 Tax=Mucilaginibacter rubeus TaxID=2027860 RepID=A0AAE6JB69_9SPHI|nr:MULTISPECIES: histidine kinase [Mucilaginibacter]QEM02427.1 sensor histidine kinase [Mucilaginibacter rubeus]QEM15051.1 sensor histidine kinase [Mucilaginibacter gossypii]QTE42230.1 histidine kinase [Mucilaginibacter rubeus]QTE48832.1 histidine kinase [Mucilaginibacter rubeus]QTE53929.1 histidine kinase [Mucilaginibacter rubeus]
MSLKSKSNTITILIHVLIWVVFGLLLFFYQPLSWNVEIPYQFWVKQAVTLFILVAAYYFNSKLLVPRFLLHDRIGMYFMAVVGVVIVFLMLNSWADKVLHMHEHMEAVFHRQHRPPKPRDRGGWDFFGTVIVALVLGISTSITAIQKWQMDIRLRQALEQDKISSELSFLKAQINPHFFFNTLNNIYALTHVNAETSRKALHQLSRMMRYVLYDTQHGTALLSQEIAFIKDYISLMELRLTQKVTVTFTPPAHTDDVTVAPMIFLPFVENAFKHGISATEPSAIRIIIDQHDSLLELKVENGIYKDHNPSIGENKGIGLTNTIRRLDLLYAGKYKLDITEDVTANIYTVHLTLNLS